MGITSSWHGVVEHKTRWQPVCLTIVPEKVNTLIPGKGGGELPDSSLPLDHFLTLTQRKGGGEMPDSSLPKEKGQPY
jgi:hypothetical protein